MQIKISSKQNILFIKDYNTNKYTGTEIGFELIVPELFFI